MTGDRRSLEAQAYRKLYKSARWLRLRQRHLAQHPLCERHLARDRIMPADTVHHVTAHKGDITLFFDPYNLESVCATCHSADIQSEEHHGYSKAVDESGWPTDHRHPANRARG